MEERISAHSDKSHATSEPSLLSHTVKIFPPPPPPGDASTVYMCCMHSAAADMQMRTGERERSAAWL